MTGKGERRGWDRGENDIIEDVGGGLKAESGDVTGKRREGEEIGVGAVIGKEGWGWGITGERGVQVVGNRNERVKEKKGKK